MTLDVEVLKKYAKRGMNVLLTGKHGVGKTAIISEVFGEVFGERNVKWRYFSGPTMDPWVDFVGIPKQTTREDGVEVIKIIPPEGFVGDEGVEAIFIDEINRADQKTLNGIMELLQFKSINGRKFKNLKCVWGAENPSIDTTNDYMVIDLDPAQRDRFNIQLNVPYSLDVDYFKSKFDDNLFDVAKRWWEETETNRNAISPRKLEDILHGFIIGDNIIDYSNKIDLTKLENDLKSVSEFNFYVEAADTLDKKTIEKTFTIDTLSKKQILFGKEDAKIKIFDKIYPFLDDEVKSHVSSTFSYTYVPHRVSKLTAKQQEIISDRNKSAKTVFEYRNVQKIKDIITETVNNFTPEFVKDSDNMTITDYEAMFPMLFDIDNYNNSDDVSSVAGVICSNDNDSKKFRDFFKICVISAISIGKHYGATKLKDSGIYQFISKVDRAGNKLGNTHYKLSVVVRQSIISEMAEGNFAKAMEIYNDKSNELFIV